MKLYDFSLYAQRRHAAQAVAATTADLDRPGSIIELKQKVSTWLELHREVTKQVA